ncbi:hypothetical protein FRB94_007685 [Tulasnella sp. JGI-2019a]|nr:hypothetical protein FRB94_007685 [Tulasnella sp. JGI-2019a]
MVQTQSSRSAIRLITRQTTVVRSTSARFFGTRVPFHRTKNNRIAGSHTVPARSFDITIPRPFNSSTPSSNADMSASKDTVTVKTKKVDTTARLGALRTLMQKADHDVQAYIIPSEDQHSSEYLAECDARRAYISGFNGSAGCAIITLNNAYMFTDGRYFLQAAEQMDSNWTLMKQGLPEVPTWQDFLHKNLPPNSKIGIDPTLISASDAESISSSLSSRSGSTLVPLAENLVDQVWTGRPARPKTKARALAVEFAGQSSQEKVEALRAELKKQDADAVVVTMLDEVAWLFNLRGSDIDFNPVFFAYAVVTTTTSTLYIDPAQLSILASQSDSCASSVSGKSTSFTTKISPDHLPLGVKIKEYTDIWADLAILGSDAKKVLVDRKASLKVLESINNSGAAAPTSSVTHIASAISSTPKGKPVGTLVRSPIADLKSIKNETEIYGFRACHVRDGVALARYFAWLEETLEKGEEEVSEWKAAEVLEKYRAENELFQGLSFTTISSTGPNAAVIHYSPDPNDCAIIKKDQMYLCDSGAQYLDGTTDVTRTWHFGEPSEEERRAFTRVLQGHIAIDTAVFPQGTTGAYYDRCKILN